MADISRRLHAVSDSRGRIVSIFVGAVLLPSIALSVMSFNAVPKQAENLKLSLLRQAEQLLYYVEEDLEQATRRRALEAHWLPYLDGRTDFETTIGRVAATVVELDKRNTP